MYFVALLRFAYILSACISCFLVTDTIYVNSSTLFVFAFGLLVYYLGLFLKKEMVLKIISFVGSFFSSIVIAITIGMWKGPFSITVNLDTLNITLLCQNRELLSLQTMSIIIIFVFFTAELLINLYLATDRSREKDSKVNAAEVM